MSEEQGIPKLSLFPVRPEDIRAVLAHTEIIETPEVDLIASPGQVWFMGKDSDPIVPRWGGEVSMEVELPEDQFWRLLAAVLGPEEVAEIKQGLDDLLRWEGEGGSCLS